MSDERERPTRMSARDELIQMIWDDAVADRVRGGKSPQTVPVVRPKVEAMADRILAAGYRKPRTVTEWAAGFKDSNEVYNIHASQEDARRFVDVMNEVGAEMIVLSREVPQDSPTAWKPEAIS